MATVVTYTGLANTTGRIHGTGTEPTYVNWGTGAGTAAQSDTTLFTESTDESRVSGTASVVTTTQTDDTWQLVATQTCATAGKTITNAGNFDASTAGNLDVKGDFTGIALSVGDSIQFTITKQFS